MPIMNFDLEDGKPPVSFSINGEGAERFMAFMDECQAIRDSAQGDALSQQAGKCHICMEDLSGYEQGRAAGIEEAATVSEKTNSHGEFIAANIRALAAKPAEGGAL